MIPLLALAVAQGAPSIVDLDKLVQARDVAGLSGFVENLPSQNPLDVIRTNGPYEVGVYGWHAKELVSADGKQFVVLTTPLTSEDVGAFLFSRDGDKLRWIPEWDAMGAHVLGHSFDVAFDVPNHSVSITDLLRFNSTGEGFFSFRMGGEYQISSITDASGKPVPFAEAGGVTLVNRPAPGDATYKVVYSGVVDRPQFAGSIGSTEATLANEYWYPMVAREPAPYTATVHAPKGWTIVGQGVREAAPDDPNQAVALFKMDLPVTYYSVSAGRYGFQSLSVGSRSFTCWSPRLTEDQMKAQAETLAPVIGFYENFGRFPFPGYGDLDSPAYGGGALEAYSYATYGGGLPEEDAHEPSHTWWGGIIDNTYLHSFWNESFAVFSEGLYRREVGIGNRAERKVAFIQDGGTRPAFDECACATAGADRGEIANTLGYGKGAKVLQMLEMLMGTDSMIASMNRWVREQPRGKPGEWEDFERAAEEQRPDLNLQAFFADWLDRPGHADFDATLIYEGGNLKIGVTFKDKAYRIPLEVLSEFSDGTSQTSLLDVSDSGVYSVAVREKPSLVSLDPYLRLVRTIGRDELPVRLNEYLSGFSKYVDPAHKDWGATFGARDVDPLPADPAGAFLIGSPESSPLMVQLCSQAGFEVKGNRLTYDGTTVDLEHGGAIALLDLPGGNKCAIGLGKSRIPPNYGNARLALFDDLGRVLRAKAEPKTEGHLTFKL